VQNKLPQDFRGFGEDGAERMSATEYNCHSIGYRIPTRPEHHIMRSTNAPIPGLNSLSTHGAIKPWHLGEPRLWNMHRGSGKDICLNFVPRTVIPFTPHATPGNYSRRRLKELGHRVKFTGISSGLSPQVASDECTEISFSQRDGVGASYLQPGRRPTCLQRLS
jgi:hypothetical protein